MNMFLLLCQHGHHLCRHFPPPFEGNVFNNPFVVSCLIWAIVVLVLGIIIACLVYCYYKSKNNTKQAIAEAAQKHEMDMKEEAFEQEKYWHEESKKAKEMDYEKEKFWYFQKELKIDYQKELNDRIQKLEEEKKELSEDLEKEKKDRNEALKKERLQAEHDFYEKIISQFHSTEENHI